MYIYTTQQGTSESHVITANAVDITGYAKIHVIYQIVSTYSTGDYGKLQVFTNNGVWVNNVGEGIYHAVVDLPTPPLLFVIVINCSFILVTVCGRIFLERTCF